MSTTPDPTPVDGPFDAYTVPDPDPTPTAEEPVAAPAAAEEELPPVREDVPPRVGKTTASMREADLRALYAAAGATEVLVGAVRGTVTETSRWASARLSELRFRRAELAKQAEEMRQRAEGLPEEVKSVPDAAKTRVADLQQQATGTYSDLANRGQRVLHDVRSEVVNRIDPAFERLQERLESARRAIRGAAAPKPSTPAAAAAASAPASDGGVTTPEPETSDLGHPDAVVVEEIVVADTTPFASSDEDARTER